MMFISSVSSAKKMEDYTISIDTLDADENNSQLFLNWDSQFSF